MPRRANQFQEPRRLGQRSVGGHQDAGPQGEIVPHARPPAVGDVDPAAGAAAGKAFTRRAAIGWLMTLCDKRSMRCPRMLPARTLVS
jgi:hypothetical protein